MKSDKFLFIRSANTFNLDAKKEDIKIKINKNKSNFYIFIIPF